MNATIEKIVHLLFEDLVETEETTAIREEILNNCQERYQDLREAGISEDDAIHAVIESLSGMEEMLSEYPRKGAEPAVVPAAPEAEAADEKEEEEPCAWSCDPALSPIREIRMAHMAGTNVYVQLSQDHLVHVELECEKPNLTLLTGTENGVLTIALSEQKEHEIKDEIKFSLQDGFDLASIGKLFEKIARRISASITGAEITLSIPASLCPELQIGTASGSVTVEPISLNRLMIGTASGDVELASLRIQNDLRVTSASGDITITGASASQLQISSTSGDIEASDCLIQENVKLNTTSGDISWCEQCKTFDAVSVSGDISMEGCAEIIRFRTVSGDVELHPTGSALGSVSGNTTSGDVGIFLPEGTKADVSCSTVSGDVYNHAGSIPGAAVSVKVNTVSGDIEIN